MSRKILTIEDITLLVDSFYAKVRADELLSNIFNNVIQDRWPEHLQKMYRFWQTVLLDEHTYYGSPFAPHAKLEIEKKHFQRWLMLFHATVDDLFEGDRAEEAKLRSNKMAEMFQYKIEYNKATNIKPIQ
jgi:hemoglobin